MQELNTLLKFQSNVLFVAPTGWGKTTMLLDLIKNSTFSWVYLSPLRALANEFSIRSMSSLKGAYLMRHHQEVKEFVQKKIEFKLLIITPELFDEKIVDFFPKQTVFIFDEIHLFYVWGLSFRPTLLECLETVFAHEFSCLLLTATMSENLHDQWIRGVRLNYENSFLINVNNHTLKKDPKKIYYVPKLYKNDLLIHLEFFKTPKTKLIFCAYREEVKQIEERLKNKGYNVLSCVGGETELFSLSLAKNSKPDFIIATTAISHGVNLPQISLVYISYKLENLDFWIQMIGRAGRQGEEFVVFSSDNYRLNPFLKIRSILYLLFIKLKNRILPYELRRYFNSQNSL